MKTAAKDINKNNGCSQICSANMDGRALTIPWFAVPLLPFVYRNYTDASEVLVVVRFRFDLPSTHSPGRSSCTP